MTQIELQERIAGKVEGILLGKKRMQNARIAQVRNAARSLLLRAGYTEPETRGIVQDAVDMAELRARSIFSARSFVEVAAVTELRARAGNIHERGSERWQEVRAEESGPDNDTGADE